MREVPVLVNGRPPFAPYDCAMHRVRDRVIDSAGSELASVDVDEPIGEGGSISLAGIGRLPIIEVYDDEDGREGGVHATVVVDEP